MSEKRYKEALKELPEDIRGLVEAALDAFMEEMLEEFGSSSAASRQEQERTLEERPEKTEGEIEEGDGIAAGRS